MAFSLNALVPITLVGVDTCKVACISPGACFASCRTPFRGLTVSAVATMAQDIVESAMLQSWLSPLGARNA